MKDVPEEHPFFILTISTGLHFSHIFFKNTIYQYRYFYRNVTFGISQIFLLFNNQSTKQRRNKHQLSLPKEFISV